MVLRSVTKCHIITEGNIFEKAHQIFVHDELEIVDCCRVLGSLIVFHNALFFSKMH